MSGLNDVYTVPESSDENALEKPSVMQAFRDRVNKFWNTYTDLEERANDVPQKLRPEYDQLMSRGRAVRNTIENITNTYDAVAEWISDILGLNGTEMGLDGLYWSDISRGNLGVIPFVPLAVVAGASTFIVKWLKDAYVMHRKLDEVQRLEKQGYDSERAAEIAEKTIGGGALVNLDISWRPIILFGLAGLGLWYANRRGWI